MAHLGSSLGRAATDSISSMQLPSKKELRELHCLTREQRTEKDATIQLKPYPLSTPQGEGHSEFVRNLIYRPQAGKWIANHGQLLSQGPAMDVEPELSGCPLRSFFICKMEIKAIRCCCGENKEAACKHVSLCYPAHSPPGPPAPLFSLIM